MRPAKRDRPELSLAGRLAAAGLLLVVAVAGCSDEPPAVAEVAGQQTFVEGVVVTEAIVPIANATVTVMPGELTALTDAGGAFKVGPVEPGTYSITARVDGYATTSVTAPAGPELVRLVLAAVRTDVPYIDVISFDGYHDCTFDFYVDGVGSQTLPCGIADCVTGQDISTDVWLFEFRVESPGLKGILAELVWDSQPTAPANQMGMHLRSVAEAGGCVDAGGTQTDIQYASLRGSSPLQMWVIQGIENPGADDGALFHDPQNETRLYQVMTVGRADYNATADVHLMLQSRQQLFITLFYHQLGDPSYTVLASA